MFVTLLWLGLIYQPNLKDDDHYSDGNYFLEHGADFYYSNLQLSLSEALSWIKNLPVNYFVSNEGRVCQTHK